MTARRLARLLRLQARELVRLGRRTRKRLDADEVHDLRVLTRRLRAALWVGRFFASKNALLRARNGLRKLGRILGERRLLDVTLRDAEAYRLDAAGLQPRHRRSERAVRKNLAPLVLSSLAKELRLAACALGSTTKRSLPEGLAQRAGALRLALARAPRSKAQLHGLRIEAKKVRYVLGCLGRQGELLKPLQDRLGRCHDLEVLQRLLGRCPRAAEDEARERAAARRCAARSVARALGELARAAWRD